MSGPQDREQLVAESRRLPALLARIGELGTQVEVVLLGDAGGLAADLRAHGVFVRVLPSAVPPSPAGLLALPRSVAALRRVVRAAEADVLEGDEPMPAIALGLAVRPGSHPPLAYRRHHSVAAPTLRAASAVAAHLADTTMTSTEAVRRLAAADDRVALSRVLVATNGMVDLRSVAPDEVTSLRAALGIPADAPVIGVVSRLRWEKGLDVLLAALDDVDVGGVQVVIAGSGPEEASLRAAASRTSVPVHFVGRQEDVERWYALADVLAIPSRRETFGRVTLEVMAAGRPLVASNVGGLPEAITDGETGVLVPPEDPFALARALTTLLRDRDLAGRLAGASRARFEARHTIDHMARSWIEGWQRTLASSRRRAR
jgi:glycosyltransferase involved in cell wall biosynthesis